MARITPKNKILIVEIVKELNSPCTLDEITEAYNLHPKADKNIGEHEIKRFLHSGTTDLWIERLKGGWYIFRPTGEFYVREITFLN